MKKIIISLSIIFFFIIIATAMTQDSVWLGTKTLSLFNTHTNEYLKIDYVGNNGQVSPEALQQISYFLRCPDTNEVKTVDPQLILTLGRIHDHFGEEKTIEVISGYRTPTYNELLRSRSEGVARNSLHTQAKAIDIKIPGVELEAIYDFARQIRQGGAGLYPSRFVHIDVGPVRYW